MKYLLFIVFLAAVLLTAGCSDKDQGVSAVPSPVTTAVPVPTTTTAPPATTVVTTVTTTQVTVPTPVKIVEPNITEGYWCRETTINIDKANTLVTECYQFFDDGTYKWGYSPGQLMGKSASCSGSPSEKCRYSLNAQGKYEVEGGYSYKLDGVYLIDPHDPPYFTWTEKGIP